MSYVIKLSNGRELKDVELSGTTFISPEKLERSDFEGAMSPVEIIGPDPESQEIDLRGRYERMRLTMIFRLKEKTCFTLQEVERPDELSVEALRAEVDYLKMLAWEE